MNNDPMKDKLYYPYEDKKAIPNDEDHWKMIATRYEMALEAIVVSASNSNTYLSTLKSIAEIAMGKENKK